MIVMADFAALFISELNLLDCTVIVSRTGKTWKSLTQEGSLLMYPDFTAEHLTLNQVERILASA
jgi:hypothetical protein